LRVSFQGVPYRILYFFNGTIAVVVSHGLVKLKAIPPKAIERAVEHKKQFLSNPSRHTYREF
jgi:hypothetical protein